MLAQLREIRASKNDAVTALLVAKNERRLLPFVVDIGTLTDPTRLHAALKERIQLVLLVRTTQRRRSWAVPWLWCALGSEGRRQISTLPDAVRWDDGRDAGATTGTDYRPARQLVTEVGETSPISGN